MSKIILAIAFLLAACAFAPQLSAAEPFADDLADFETEIIYAGYAALDSDGLENDIVIYLKIDNAGQWQSAFICVEIELPSGKSHANLVPIETSEDSLRLRVEAHETAEESGWYILWASGALQMAQDWYYGPLDSYTFDPPGGSKNGATPSWTWEIL